MYEPLSICAHIPWWRPYFLPVIASTSFLSSSRHRSTLKSFKLDDNCLQSFLTWHATLIFIAHIHLTKSPLKAFVMGRQNLEGGCVKLLSVTFRRTRQICSTKSRPPIGAQGKNRSTEISGLNNKWRKTNHSLEAFDEFLQVGIVFKMRNCTIFYHFLGYYCLMEFIHAIIFSPIFQTIWTLLTLLRM